MRKIELLAPAGDTESFMMAIEYGADSVYFGGEHSLRAPAGFSTQEIAKCVTFAHEHGKKAYMALNVFAHENDINDIRSYLITIKNIGIDAFLVSDPGVLSVLRSVIPDAVIHISTQANTLNSEAVKFWASQGAKRIVLARELSLEEIRKIRSSIPGSLELEAFCHGAMCISYSGRCLLSNYLIGRDANKGLCAHPCRWKYSLEEEKRPGKYYSVEEDENGSYFFNSDDLCMIEHIKDMIDSGIDSLKIEGRMKSCYYVATVVRAYRLALDAVLNGEEIPMDVISEVSKTSHRDFTTGSYYGRPDEYDQNYSSSSYTRDYTFVAKVISYDENSKTALVEQRNKFSVGDNVEVLGPGPNFYSQKVVSIVEQATGAKVTSAPHPMQKLYIPMDIKVEKDYIIRMKSKEDK